MSNPDCTGPKKVCGKRSLDMSKDVKDGSDEVIGSTLDNEDGSEAGLKHSDVTHKRPRGPFDCLNWSEDEDEEDLGPYTQLPEPVEEPPPSPKKVFAKKSVAKNGETKNGAKNASSKKASSSKAKGKSIGKSLLI